MTLLRQILFNIVFYVFTAVCCILYVPFALMPRKIYVVVLRRYFLNVHLIEKYILGLDYELRGVEHLPPVGTSYIAAIKHYSEYETMKLYPIFNDPAIILKKELTYIPFWGWLLMRADMIAIQRGTGEKAMKAITDGAVRIMKNRRPITIFPQGTRVPITATPSEYPYKRGVIRMYEATGLPIIPVATNSGYFWPKNAFLKRPGKVIFQILPPIPPGQSTQAVMKELEASIEKTSSLLVEEAKAKYP
jgi:1-acyl-sn-glycerol-3-phosphate acyltransferase